MATVKRGQFFLHHKAIKEGVSKPKFFICLIEGEDLDDEILCLVINSERRIGMYQPGCNKQKAKFVLTTSKYSFDFLKHDSSIMLLRIFHYKVADLFADDIRILNDVANDGLCRQIKNCIDKNNLLSKEEEVLKYHYK